RLFLFPGTASTHQALQRRGDDPGLLPARRRSVERSELLLGDEAPVARGGGILDVCEKGIQRVAVPQRKADDDPQPLFDGAGPSRAVRARPRGAGRRGDARRDELGRRLRPLGGLRGRGRRAGVGPRRAAADHAAPESVPSAARPAGGAGGSTARRVTRDVEPSVLRRPRQASSCPGRSVDDRNGAACDGGVERGRVRSHGGRATPSRRSRELARSETSFGECDGEGRSVALLPSPSAPGGAGGSLLAEARVYFTENVHAHNVVFLRSAALTTETFFVPRFLV